ncbi:MAG: SBBP repeat-containing protein [Bacteroidetes bacterium]|nr:SBBP repeat-containing protein [Bacteroidota bacterium]
MERKNLSFIPAHTTRINHKIVAVVFILFLSMGRISAQLGSSCSTPYEICEDLAFNKDVSGFAKIWYTVDVSETPFDFDITFTSGSTMDSIFVWGPFTSPSDSCTIMTNGTLPAFYKKPIGGLSHTLLSDSFPAGEGIYVIVVRYGNGFHSIGVDIEGIFNSACIPTVCNPLVTISVGNKFCWVKKGGSKSAETGWQVRNDALGNSYVTGVVRDTAIFDSFQIIAQGSADGFIAKYDPNGICLWVKNIGSVSDDRSISLDLDNSNNIYVTGYFTGTTVIGSTLITSYGSFDSFIAKFDANGNFLWANHFGGTSNDFSNNLVVDSSGNCYIAGGTNSSTVNFDTISLSGFGGLDAFIVKYNSSGVAQWAKNGGGNSGEQAFGVAIDHSGNVYITGLFASATATFGAINLTKTGTGDMFLTKYSSTGTVVWAVDAGQNLSTQGNKLEIDAVGNVLMIGTYTGSSLVVGTSTVTSAGSNDIFIAKYNSSGTPLWAKGAGGSGDDQALGIAMDGPNDFIISGYYSGTAIFGSDTMQSNGAEDIFMAKYRALNGNFIWSKVVEGDTLNDEAFACNVDVFNNKFITGFFRKTNSFDGVQLTSAGDNDFYLAKLCAHTPVVVICIDSSITLYASGADEYSWSPSSGLSATSGTKIIASPTVTTTYTVIGLLAGTSCRDTNTITIVVDSCIRNIPCYSCISSFAPELGKKYIVSAWAKEESAPRTKTTFDKPELYVEFPSIAVSFGPFKPSGEIIDGWQRIEGSFVVPNTATNIKIKLTAVSGTAFFDDVRVHPFDGMMKSFVYDPQTMRLAAELDERNYATLFEYDEEGKRTRIKKETEKGIMTIEESKSNKKKR